jgi:hypothetical protein
MSLTKKKAEKAKSIEPVIPDKLYFRIGEVAELCELPTYVLRFWDTEFPQLRPTKSSTGRRAPVPARRCPRHSRQPDRLALPHPAHGRNQTRAPGLA